MNPQQPPAPGNQNQPLPPVQPPAPNPPQPLAPTGAQPNIAGVDTAFSAHSGQEAPHIDPQEYEFIMNPPKPVTGLAALASGEDKKSRLTVVAIGGVGVLILLLIVAKLLSHPNPIAAAMLPVVQEQQEILHLTSQTVAPTAQLSANQANFVATTAAVITSSSVQLNAYLSANKIKLNPKLLGAKIDPAVDQQLTTAAGSGIFQSTYNTVMANALSAYASDLHAAFSQVKGPKGQAYLSSEFKQTQTLYTDLKSISS